MIIYTPYVNIILEFIQKFTENIQCYVLLMFCVLSIYLPILTATVILKLVIGDLKMTRKSSTVKLFFLIYILVCFLFKCR